MTDPTEATCYAFEHPDEAGYPDGKGTLSQDQAVIIDELLDDPHVPAFDFTVVKDEKTGIYGAIVGDRQIAGPPYNVAGDDRLVLLATSSVPRVPQTGHRHRADPTCAGRRARARKDGHHHVPGRAHLHRAQPRVRRPHQPQAPASDQGSARQKV